MDEVRMTPTDSRFTPFMPLPPACVLDGDVMRSAFFSNGAEFLSSGRGALLRILRLEKFGEGRRIFLPHFFCPQISKSLAKSFDVRFFEDLPCEKTPRFETLDAKCGDIVLAVNFLGLRDRNIWDSWEKPDGVVLAEDHSHAPFSHWAANSSADYSFASLRKYLPLPDGAWLKSKSKEASKMFLRGGDMDDFAADALCAAATVEKLKDASSADFSLALYYGAEAKLNALEVPSRMSGYSFEMLGRLNLEKIAKLRRDNLSAFCAAFGENPHVKILNGGSEFVEDEPRVFYPALKFENAAIRNAAYAELRRRGIFCPIFWGGLGESASESARRASDTMFLVPLDFRHTVDDAAMLAETLRDVLRGCR